MSDHEKPAMNEDEIETTAWELETKMMEIRKDPRAALTAGLARIRAIMCAEMRADIAKTHAAMEARMEAGMAEGRAKLEAELAKREAKLNALMAAEEEKVKAEADALMFRLRQINTREEAQRFCSEMEAQHAHRAETT